MLRGATTCKWIGTRYGGVVGVVTVDGELVECSKHHPEEGGPQGRFARGLTEINHQFKGLIEGRKNAPQSRGGYRFDGIIDADGSVDLAKFMVGTQGTRYHRGR